MIRLEIIHPDNWRLGLRVSEAQGDFVADDMCLLARAYAYRESRSNALLIYHNDDPVGMALYYDCDEAGAFDFSQFFIDERYQGRGYGIEAARNMYEKLGFYLTGEADGNEIVMEKRL